MSVQATIANTGVVSVVVVNFRGADDTIECLRRLIRLDFPPEQLELICVDNASGDDSVERIRAAMPSGVRLVESETNTGFTGGCNLGVTEATGEFLAFINNDARPDERWLAEAVAALRADSTVGCVASKVLDWDGVNIDFVDAALTWYGMGYKPRAGSPYEGDRERAVDVLFPTGAAMVVRASLFREIGGFDERFFMFYEDVDLGWRLNLLGHRVRYVPTSLVYHKHHATMNKFGQFREWYLLERNALACLYKNLEDVTLARVLAPALALSVRRGLATGGADTSILDLQRTAGGDDEPDTTISKQSLTGAFAVDSFVDLLPSLNQTRERLQQARVRSDRELMPLLRQAIEPAIPNERYLAAHAALVEAFGIAELFGSRHRIVILTSDPLGARMAGPGIRAVHMAHELASEHDVRLVSTAGCSLSDPRFTAKAVSMSRLHDEVEWAEIVVFQGLFLTHLPWLRRTQKILVPDLYDPMHIEQLEQTKGDEPTARNRDLSSTLADVNMQLDRGDLILCASEKQRHFWLGQMMARGRVNPRTYDSDSTLGSLLAVAPFGLASERPVRARQAIKGVVPGIELDDKVILWAGGIYNWFDPSSLVRAVLRVSKAHPDVKLFFLGTQHPNPGVPAMRVLAEVRELSDQLGLTGKSVFFNEGWVDYDDRQNYLLDADVGVSTHFEHIETTFAFRTRILDYIWAGLPLVVTEGDTFADLVRDRELGITVRERDVDGLADALERCLYDEKFAAQCRDNVAAVRPMFEWSATLKPLLDFCRAPHRALDAEVGQLSSSVAARESFVSAGGVRADIALAKQYLAAGGLREVFYHAAGRIRRIRS